MNNAHAQDVQNGVIVDDVRGDLRHCTCTCSLRTAPFCANSNICFLLNPTRNAVVVLEWSGRSELPWNVFMASSFLFCYFVCNFFKCLPTNIATKKDSFHVVSRLVSGGLG